MAFIQCKNLSAGYDNAPVLEDISFQIEAGEYIALVGKNGSGKTTLIKCLAGLMRPKTGALLLEEEAAGLGYLPQQTAIQRDFPASVWEVVLSGCLNRRGRRPFFSPGEKALAAASLKEMGLGQIRRKSYRKLSGGQQQRVLLARALCAAQKLLILDEPARGLDPQATGELYAHINRLHQEKGMTIIMATHDLENALENADKVLHLDKKILFWGSPAEYRGSAASRCLLGGEEDA